MNRPLILIGTTIGAFFVIRAVRNYHPYTWDDKTNAIISKLHPKIRRDAAKVVNALYKKGIKIRFISGLRTFMQQNFLYAQGRSVPGNIVTKAKGGQSYHNYGLAIDVQYPDKYRNQVVNEFKKRGFEWGGEFKNFPDAPHFQKRFGYTWNDFLTRKKYIKGTSYPIFS